MVKLQRNAPRPRCHEAEKSDFPSVNQRSSANHARDAGNPSIRWLCNFRYSEVEIVVSHGLDAALSLFFSETLPGCLRLSTNAVIDFYVRNGDFRLFVLLFEFRNHKFLKEICLKRSVVFKDKQKWGEKPLSQPELTAKTRVYGICG